MGLRVLALGYVLLLAPGLLNSSRVLGLVSRACYEGLETLNPTKPLHPKPLNPEPQTA